MKKGSYWFTFLSEIEQKQFKENCNNLDYNFEKQMEFLSETFNYFILSAFNWRKTPEGNDYWFLISNRKVK